MTFHDKDRKFKKREQIKFPETIKKRAQSVFKMIFFFPGKRAVKVNNKMFRFQCGVYLFIIVSKERD